MIAMTLAMALLVSDETRNPTGKEGLEIGKRLAAAIQGKADFSDGDFLKPLADADKIALRRFSSCKIDNVGHAMMADPKEPNTFVRQFDFISISMRCKGAPRNMPVGISLHLEHGKIAKVETHNADLMSAN